MHSRPTKTGSRSPVKISAAPPGDQARFNRRPQPEEKYQSTWERVCEAIVSVTPQVIEAASSYPSFHEAGKRMLHALNAEMNSLRLRRTWSLPSLTSAIEEAGFAEPRRTAPPRNKSHQFLHSSATAGKRVEARE